METVNVLLQAISTIGFPIVMCGAMFWKINEQDKMHKEEMEALQKTIQQNTLAIQQLIDKFDR